MVADRSKTHTVSDDYDISDARTKSNESVVQIAYSENPSSIKKFVANATAFLDNKGLLAVIERDKPRDIASWSRLIAPSEVNTMSQNDLTLTYVAYTTEFWNNSRKAFNYLSQWKGLANCNARRPSPMRCAPIISPGPTSFGKS